MVFDQIIFYTCDMCLKQNILNPLSIFFLSNDLKTEFFAL
jgi:hypothetical protein